jgi:hypothetical protein
MYHTIATWDIVPVPDINTNVNPKLIEMTTAGQTDGVAHPDWPSGNVGVPPLVVTRFWIDEAAAQEWKTFIEAVTPITPTTVVIFKE